MSIEEALESGRQSFVAESRDLIVQAEAALLALEENPDDSEALGALFRAAHTIKGSAGLFGFDRVVAFTHVLENVFDRVRSGRQSLNPGLMEIALRCADHLGHLLDVIDQNGNDASLDPALVESDAALLGALVTYLRDPVATDVTVADRADYDENLDAPGAGDVPEDGGVVATDTPVDPVARDGWHISVRFGANVLRNGMDPLSFVRYLGKLGHIERLVTVTDHLPAPAAFDPESCYLGLELLLATDADERTIADAFEFVRDDCQLTILPPRAPVAAYAVLLASLPEQPARAAALLLEAGALTDEELARALAVEVTPALPAAFAVAGVPEPAGEQVERVIEGKVPEPGAPPREVARKGHGAAFIRVQADKLDV